jgi:hypothetical protein
MWCISTWRSLQFGTRQRPLSRARTISRQAPLGPHGRGGGAAGAISHRASLLSAVTGRYRREQSRRQREPWSPDASGIVRGQRALRSADTSVRHRSPRQIFCMCERMLDIGHGNMPSRHQRRSRNWSCAVKAALTALRTNRPRKPRRKFRDALAEVLVLELVAARHPAGRQCTCRSWR